MNKKNKLALRGGSYSLIISLIVLAILVVVNICAAALPSTWTKLDISATKLYSITSNTKAVVNNLDQDVTIYWIVQSGKEDDIIENLLNKYDSLSDHIDVVKKNPDIFPTFAAQYTDETVANNSVVVESGDRYRYVPYSDIYVSESDAYSYTATTSFDGEGAITSAIDYVVSDELPQVYLIEGHGEKDLPETFKDQVTKANIELQSLSLLTVDEIPEDAAAVMMYAPQSDISDEEATMLSDYVENGGKLFVMAGPVENVTLTSLYSVLEDYGVTLNEGVVVEADRNHYAFQRPYILLPDMADDDVTTSLKEERYTPIMPVASGMTVGANYNVTALLTTSDDAFSKVAGFSLTTYDKEDGDIDGPFTIAISAYSEAGGKLYWFSCSDFLDDMYNSYSSGANTNLAMNCLSSLVGEREAIAIRAKSLNYNYLTITESQGAMLKTVTIAVLPVIYLAIGVIIFVHTRRKQNEEAK